MNSHFPSHPQCTISVLVSLISVALKWFWARPALAQIIIIYFLCFSWIMMMGAQMMSNVMIKACFVQATKGVVNSFTIQILCTQTTMCCCCYYEWPCSAVAFRLVVLLEEERLTWASGALNPERLFDIDASQHDSGQCHAIYTESNAQHSSRSKRRVCQAKAIILAFCQCKTKATDRKGALRVFDNLENSISHGMHENLKENIIRLCILLKNILRERERRMFWVCSRGSSRAQTESNKNGIFHIFRRWNIRFLYLPFRRAV